MWLGGLLGGVAGLGVWAIAYLYGPGIRPSGLEVRSAPRIPPSPDPRGPASLISLPALGIGLAMALWGAYVGWRTSRLDLTVAAVLFSALLLALSLVDWRTRRLPNVLLLALLAWGLVQALWLKQPTWAAAGLGLLVGGGVFGLIALLGRGALGTGDVKLMAVLGAALGLPLILPAMLGGAIAGGLAALLLLATHRLGRKDYFAYGPYLALGAWLVWTRAVGLWP